MSKLNLHSFIILQLLGMTSNTLQSVSTVLHFPPPPTVAPFLSSNPLIYPTVTIKFVSILCHIQSRSASMSVSKPYRGLNTLPRSLIYCVSPRMTSTSPFVPFVRGHLCALGEPPCSPWISDTVVQNKARFITFIPERETGAKPLNTEGLIESMRDQILIT